MVRSYWRSFPRVLKRCLRSNPTWPSFVSRADYPRFPDLDDFDVPVEDFDKFIDLGPYLNPTPYVVSQESTLARIFRLFRTMGLRHLMVVNKYVHTAIPILSGCCHARVFVR